MSVTRALPAGLVHRAHGNQKAEDMVQYVVYIKLIYITILYHKFTDGLYAICIMLADIYFTS